MINDQINIQKVVNFQEEDVLLKLKELQRIHKQVYTSVVQYADAVLIMADIYTISSDISQYCKDIINISADNPKILTFA